MSVAYQTTGVVHAGQGVSASRIGDWTLVFVMFLSGFVLFEPAPYDLILVAVMVVWGGFALRFSRHTMPLVALLGIYSFGGIVSLTQTDTVAKGVVYIATTVFLALSAIFFASIVTDAPERRFGAIIKGYVASAVAVSLVGSAAYFRLFPGAEALIVAQRAAGTFQDPNVFGPFLVLPAMIFLHHILTNPLRRSLAASAGFMILAVGIFLSFSRAAWGLAVAATLLTAFFAYCTRTDPRDRARVVTYFVSMGIFVTLLIAIAVVTPGVGDLLHERASLVQYYDAGRLGRFARIRIGISEIPNHPVGYGPFEFGRALGEDEHNMWLKGFTVYGWLGGFAYIALAFWTLIAAFPLLFKPRPWLAITQATYAVLVGHLMLQMVIDNDHWRHVFLIYGLLWGAIAVDRMEGRRQRTLQSRPGPTIPRFAAVAVVPRN